MTMTTDTPPIRLDDVTMVAASSLAINATVSAFHRSLEQVQCAAVKFFTDAPLPKGSDARIERVPIPRLVSKAAYSDFILGELWRHVDTAHVLVIQWDGYVLDGRRWDPGFLKADYIGAPWPQFRDGMRVGNGGFSLRSTSLMRAVSTIAEPGSGAEDVVIARLLRPRLEQRGFRFADEDLARRFSFERTRRSGTEFGFHGVFNLPAVAGAVTTQQVLAGLEKGLLSRADARDTLRAAFLRGQFRTALQLRAMLALRPIGA